MHEKIHKKTKPSSSYSVSYPTHIRGWCERRHRRERATSSSQQFFLTKLKIAVFLRSFSCSSGEKEIERFNLHMEKLLHEWVKNFSSFRCCTLRDACLCEWVPHRNIHIFSFHSNEINSRFILKTWTHSSVLREQMELFQLFHQPKCTIVENHWEMKYFCTTFLLSAGFWEMQKLSLIQNDNEKKRKKVWNHSRCTNNRKNAWINFSSQQSRLSLQLHLQIPASQTGWNLQWKFHANIRGEKVESFPSNFHSKLELSHSTAARVNEEKLQNIARGIGGNQGREKW